MRLLWLFLGLAVLVLIPFFLWGGAVEAFFVQGGAVAWLRGYGPWAGVAGVLLLVSDLVLPVPGTVVMAALGYLYGPVAGGLLAAGGSFLSGAVGYGLCRALGRRGARWLLGARDLERGERLFARVGGWIVALSRWLPVFPEVVACMAGLTRMRAPVFFAALACGSLPLGFVFATIGHAGVERPVLAVVLSAGLPPLLWLAVRRWIQKKDSGNAG
ncbi:MAG: VTT domain-containing protein [Rhodothermales bacterium]|nr:VTT domain-containing protein [Rhodothermales bacterium]